VAAEALEQSVLESKDKDQLLAIAKALGIKTTSRTKKSDIIDSILETTGSSPAPTPDAGNGDHPSRSAAPESFDAPAEAADGRDPDAAPPAAGSPEVESPALSADGEPLAEWELELAALGDVANTTAVIPQNNAPGSTAAAGPGALRRGDGDRDRGVDRRGPGASTGAPALGGQPVDEQRAGRQHDDQSAGQSAGQSEGQEGQPGPGGGGSGIPRRARRRRRRKGGRGTDGPQGDDGVVTVEAEPDPTPADINDPVAVSGYLDMREEGYGFLRVKGYLPSRDDSYIPVKLARQYGLRRGDHITGLSRPAGRNEKNPALLDVLTVNGGDPEAAKRRPRFEDLTALFPDSNLRLEDPNDPTNMTARIIDLVSPIGKGQRGIIVSPPKAGKTFVMKTIATAIEKNNPEVKLIVLLIDERPEEVTDIRRTVQGEVISSTFDRPSEEHTHVAELAIEKAKRLVEMGHDVVVILDGITRLSRAYNLAAPASGRILSGGIDAGALYPPKKFFGAARNVEEGGSLTILATALVDTNSRMDEAIFEEFKGTGNMELRLDRRLAERRIYPAIDVDASSTRHEELLIDRKQLQMVWKLRRVLSGLAADGNAAPGLELLMDRLKTFRTNAEFLNEIAKQPTM